jgi:hypothetical protein
MQVSKHAKLAKKQVDDVLGGNEAWKNVQKTEGKQALPAAAAAAAAQQHEDLNMHEQVYIDFISTFIAAGVRSVLIWFLQEPDVQCALSLSAARVCVGSIFSGAT